VDELPEHLSGTLPVRVPAALPLPPPDRPHLPPDPYVMQRVRDGLEHLPDD
jgi:hypothetical protein